DVVSLRFVDGQGLELHKVRDADRMAERDLALGNGLDRRAMAEREQIPELDRANVTIAPELGLVGPGGECRTRIGRPVAVEVDAGAEGGQHEPGRRDNVRVCRIVRTARGDV